MKIAKIAALSLAVIIAVTLLSAWLYLRSRLPQVDGELRTGTIRQGVTVTRDRFGVPHIVSGNRYDLYFALGYVQAQDRMFQMDFYRRAARGRLSEVLGKDLLGADAYIRTMGFSRTAAEQMKILPPKTREMVEAFTGGINYFIKNGNLPAEFAVLGYKPDPWIPEDSLAIGNLLGFQLASWAYQNELLNYLILAKLGPAKANLLLPVYPDDAVPVISQADVSPGKNLLTARSADFIRNVLNREFASNNWVISGKLTASGKPLLCEDSHEDGPELPTQWHMVQLKGKDIDAAGAMFPGAPVFIWGHNKRIAWGLTNFNLDNQDLYIEKINPNDPTQVMYRNAWVKMRIIEEKIPYQEGGKTVYKTIKIRITPHGPIINDIEDGIGEAPISIRRVEAEPGIISEALYGISTANNWNDFKKALSLYPAGPQHFVYADVDGNIGYIGAGKCPIRTNSRGILPQPGWDGAHEWLGYYPFAAMPMEYNPVKGYFATANNYPKRGGFPIPLSEYWEPPYRAQRISDLISGKDKHTPADMITMQLDSYSVLASKVAPVFVSLLQGKIKGDEKRYLDELARWDFRVTSDSSAASLYEVLFNRLLYVTFADELGKDLYERLIKDKIAVTNIIADMLLKKQNSILFDNISTPAVETCADDVAESFRYAVKYLTDELGGAMKNWKWGAVHRIEFSHIFGAEPMLRPVFSYGPFPFQGDDQTINRGGFDKTKPYKVSITASIRYIVDFSDMPGSLIVLCGGQSANLLSPHRHDQADMFLEGAYVPWYTESAQYDKEREGVLKMVPGN